MSNKKQTAVEWQFDELQKAEKDWRNDAIDGKEYNDRKYQILKQSKEIFEQQIIDAYWDGTAQFANDARIDYPKTPEQYYSETYEQ
jgi:hypothetical protein